MRGAAAADAFAAPRAYTVVVWWAAGSEPAQSEPDTRSVPEFNHRGITDDQVQYRFACAAAAPCAGPGQWR